MKRIADVFYALLPFALLCVAVWLLGWRGALGAAILIWLNNARVQAQEARFWRERYDSLPDEWKQRARERVAVEK